MLVLTHDMDQAAARIDRLAITAYTTSARLGWFRVVCKQPIHQLKRVFCCPQNGKTMPFIDLQQLRVRWPRTKIIFCAACNCEREAIKRQSVDQRSVVWLNERTPSILPAPSAICLTCGWMHYHKTVQSKATRAAVFEADNHECIYCGATENLSIEHLIPQSRGGGHEFDNLATACGSCNRRRQAGRIDMVPRFGRYRNR